MEVYQAALGESAFPSMLVSDAPYASLSTLQISATGQLYDNGN